MALNSIREVQKLTAAFLVVIAAGVISSAQSSVPPAGPIVVAASRQVLVSIPDRKLAILEDGKVIRVFPVSVGANASASPSGSFRIVNRLTNPTYYHPGVVLPAGPNNPLGPRWVGLSQKGFGIHGTNEPWSIGRAASHGCIRMRNRDIVQFFAMVSVGDAVEIRGERDEQVAHVFGVAADDRVLAQAQTVTAKAGGAQ
ncbi:MAG TPA: L,D-transpeptidase [Terriglobales bacterium]|jgi:hypothetical protein